MNAIAEIDKAGRLVVPKKLRDALHLVPGTRVTLDQQGESIILRAQAASSGLHKKQGLWVHQADAPITAKEVRAFMESQRDAREGRILGGDSAE